MENPHYNECDECVHYADDIVFDKVKHYLKLANK